MTDKKELDEEYAIKVRALAAFGRDRLGSDGVLVVSLKDGQLMVVANGDDDFKEQLPKVAQMVLDAATVASASDPGQLIEVNKH